MLFLTVFLIVFPIAFYFLSSRKPKPELVPDLTWPGEAHLRSVYGLINPRIVCPHCMKPGMVRVKQLGPGEGGGAGKIGAAVVSRDGRMLMVGMSPPERQTQHFCHNCRSTWWF